MSDLPRSPEESPPLRGYLHHSLHPLLAGDPGWDEPVLPIRPVRGPGRPAVIFFRRVKRFQKAKRELE